MFSLSFLSISIAILHFFFFFFPSGGAAVPVPSKAMLAWVFGTAGSHCAGPGRAKGPSLSSSVIFQIT